MGSKRLGKKYPVYLQSTWEVHKRNKKKKKRKRGGGYLGKEKGPAMGKTESVARSTWLRCLKLGYQAGKTGKKAELRALVEIP